MFLLLEETNSLLGDAWILIFLIANNIYRDYYEILSSEQKLEFVHE